MRLKEIVIFITLFAISDEFLASEVDYNFRPIIGILAQFYSSSEVSTEEENSSSYIAASYVKFVESAGARAVPIFINQDDAYYERIASSVNGILFPGGGVSITNSSGYGSAGQKLYDHVVKSFKEGTNIPIWGTCQGFELITYLAANDHDWLTNCQAEDKDDKLTLKEGYMDSRIFNQMPDDVLDYLMSYNTTANFHTSCLTPSNFSDSGLSEEYRLLATSYDYDGLEYVALMEHNEMPIYGSQFHPEKNAFEWEGIKTTPHDPFAIVVGQYFSDFFINQARCNNQHFPTQEEEEAALIYNYDSVYSGLQGSVFSETYVFP